MAAVVKVRLVTGGVLPPRTLALLFYCVRLLRLTLSDLTAEGALCVLDARVRVYLKKEKLVLKEKDLLKK